MSLAEMEALITEGGDLDDMTGQYKHRLLSMMRRDHANAIRLIKELRDDIETGEKPHIERTRTKRTMRAGLMTDEAELRILMDWLTACIKEASPEEALREVLWPSCRPL
jgi:hypothetical protein